MTPDGRAGLILRRIGTALEVPERAAEEVSLALVAVRDWSAAQPPTSSARSRDRDLHGWPVWRLLMWTVETVAEARRAGVVPTSALADAEAYLSAALRLLTEAAWREATS